MGHRHSPAAGVNWGNIAREAAKFATVGAVGYVVDVGLSNVFLLVVGWGPLVAKSLSTISSMAVNYVGNRHWSFKERRPAGGPAELGSFLAVNLAGLAIVLGFVGFARYVLDLQGALAFNLVANVLGAGAAAIFSFWAYGRFVFTPRRVGRHATGAARGGRRHARIPAPRGTADVGVASFATYR